MGWDGTGVRTDCNHFKLMGARIGWRIATPNSRAIQILEEYAGGYIK